MRVLMAEASDYRGTTQVGSHALAREFARHGARVFWMGTPLYPHSVISAARDPHTRRRFGVWRKNGASTGEGVTEYYPMTFLPVMDRPLLRSRFVAENTLRATVPPVARQLHAHGFASPDIVWLSNSRFSSPAWKMARAQKSACRLSDDWAHFGHVPQSLLELHEQMVDGVDTVFVTSRRLHDKLRTRRPDAIYLPNAVADFFFQESDVEPHVLTRFPRPRVVFVGALDAWVDFDLIARVGERVPGASLLVFGPGSPKARAYPHNVHFLGPHPYRDLPALLRHCDIGIVPFVKSELTHAVSPLKLFEYLATGLATVATRLDEIETSQSPAVLCDDADQFADAVSSLLDGDPAGRDSRIAFAERHTWSKRFETVRAVLGF
jgi:glycosyltransferase involved in cell wall biosynthesis